MQKFLLDIVWRFRAMKPEQVVVQQENGLQTIKEQVYGLGMPTI